MKTPAYVINLASRPDRMKFALSEAKRVGLEVRRVEAVSAADVDPEQVSMTGQDPSRIACWESHRRAWKAAEQDGLDSFLILEDDCRWIQDPNSLLDAIARTQPGMFDLLQLGSLQGGRERLPRRSRVAFRVAESLRFAKVIVPEMRRVEAYLEDRSQLYAQKAAEMRTSAAIALDVVWGRFDSGAHAYLVSRSMVPHLMVFNWPPFLAADDALAALAHQGRFKIGRLATSIASQAPLSSDLR